jgi:hypothetical protein
MGMVKQAYIERQDRGFGDIPRKAVCEDCLQDLTLQAFVNSNASEEECSYCGRLELEPIAIPMSELMPVIMDGIRFEWAHPGDLLGWCGAEGGWQGGVTTDTEDVIRDLGVSDENEVVNDVVEAIDESEWCARNPFSQTRDEALLSAWQQFSKLVKHSTRYLFLRVADPEERKRRGDELPPAQILDHIAEAINEFDRGLVKDLDVGRIIYRARRQGAGALYDSVEDLGPPTVEQATMSTRMSAAGIPVFYGALDPDTAIKEKLERDADQPLTMAVAEFTTERPLRVLDLSCPLPVPSVFDTAKRHLRASTRFLREFVGELSRPVAGDGREHIDYVPTQVASEYFRQVFRCEDGRPLDGLLYLSAKNPPHAACVLYFGREGCAGRGEVLDEGRRSSVRVRYARSSRREVPGTATGMPAARANAGDDPPQA